MKLADVNLRGEKIRSLGLDTSNLSCLLETQEKRVNKQNSGIQRNICIYLSCES